MPDRNDIIAALNAEKAALEARGDTGRAAEVDAQLDAWQNPHAAEGADEQPADDAGAADQPAPADPKRDAADKTPRTAR